MLATLALLILVDQAQLEGKAHSTSILAGPALPTLHEFLKGEGVEFLMETKEFDGIFTKHVEGIYTPCEVLRLLIAGTPIIVWDSKRDVEADCGYSPLRLRY